MYLCRNILVYRNISRIFRLFYVIGNSSNFLLHKKRSITDRFIPKIIYKSYKILVLEIKSFVFSDWFAGKIHTKFFEYFYVYI